MRTANRFKDNMTGETYLWPINHETEENFGKSRAVTNSAPTNGLGLMQTQGDAQPLVLSWKGQMLTKAQVVETIRWWQKCESRTIEIRDFTGDEYEVLITNFVPLRKRVVKNTRGGTDAPMHYWEYTLEMRVLRVISGTWAGVAA